MKARPVSGLDPAGTLADNAERIVRTRLDEMCSFMPKAADPGEVTALHDMRIAAKRLRYVLEITHPCFGAYAQDAVRLCKDLQDLLGEIHDCDVMLPRVAGHRRALRLVDAEAVRAQAAHDPDLDPKLAARAPHRTSYRGLDVLEVYLRARRALLFDRFTELWAASEDRGVWSGLGRAAEREIARADEMRRAAERAERARDALAEAERLRIEVAERAGRAAAELAEAEAGAP